MNVIFFINLFFAEFSQYFMLLRDRRTVFLPFLTRSKVNPELHIMNLFRAMLHQCVVDTEDHFHQTGGWSINQVILYLPVPLFHMFLS